MGYLKANNEELEIVPEIISVMVIANRASRPKTMLSFMRCAMQNPRPEQYATRHPS